VAHEPDQTDTERMQGSGRPDVMMRLSTTQVEELERQFSEHDEQGWKRLCSEYSWSDQECKMVHDWFENQPGRTG
jgi:hypothetical protein